MVEVTMPILFPQLGRMSSHCKAFVLSESGTIVFKGDVYFKPVSHDFGISPDTGYEMPVDNPLTPDEFRAVPWDRVQYTSVRYDTLRFEFSWQGPGVELRADGPRVYELRLTKYCGPDDVTRLQWCVRRKIEERRRRQRTLVVTKGLYCRLGDASFVVARFSCKPDVVPEEDLLLNS